MKTLTLSITVIVASCFLFSSCKVHREPPKVKVNTSGTVLSVQDHQGNLLWRKRFNDPLHRGKLDRGYKHEVCDLENDGRYEIIIVKNDFRQVASEDFLTCINEDGSLKWALKLTEGEHKIPYQRAGQFDWGPDFPFFPCIWLSKFLLVDDLNNDGYKELVLLLGASGPFNSSLLIVLDSSGKERYRFWIPGATECFKIFKSPITSEKVILVQSYNSHLTPMEEKEKCYYRHSVFMLDAAMMANNKENPIDAKPPAKDSRILHECCIWYRLLHRWKLIKPEVIKNPNNPFEVGIWIEDSGSGEEEPSRIQFSTPSGLVGWLDWKGKLLDLELSSLHTWKEEVTQKFEEIKDSYYDENLFYSHEED